MNTKIKDLSLNIPRDLWKHIIKYYEEEYEGIIPKKNSMKLFVTHRIYGAYVQLERLKSIKIKPTRGLDAGCGIGTFVVLANLYGYNFYGYDIDKKAVAIAKKLLKANNISSKKIGYSPNIINSSFDLITSFEVIEHVANMQNYFNKLIRILSPNGSIFTETPNYLIPFEPHYYTFILPFGLRAWNWFFCRLKGATNKRYFDGINFVNKYSLEGIFKKNDLKFKNIGYKEWIEQIVNPPQPINDVITIKFKNIGDKKWTEQIIRPPNPVRSVHFFRISKLVRDFRLLPLVKFFTWIGFYTPLVYLVSPEEEANNHPIKSRETK